MRRGHCLISVRRPTCISFNVTLQFYKTMKLLKNHANCQAQLVGTPGCLILLELIYCTHTSYIHACNGLRWCFVEKRLLSTVYKDNHLNYKNIKFPHVHDEITYTIKTLVVHMYIILYVRVQLSKIFASA